MRPGREAIVAAATRHRLLDEHPEHATTWTVLLCPVCRHALDTHMARLRAKDREEATTPCAS